MTQIRGGGEMARSSLLQAFYFRANFLGCIRMPSCIAFRHAHRRCLSVCEKLFYDSPKNSGHNAWIRGNEWNNSCSFTKCKIREERNKKETSFILFYVAHKQCWPNANEQNQDLLSQAKPLMPAA